MGLGKFEFYEFLLIYGMVRLKLLLFLTTTQYFFVIVFIIYNLINIIVATWL